ncbi:MAG: DNA-3-methyladenine glycosylase [Actinomycetota bacterium]
MPIDRELLARPAVELAPWLLGGVVTSNVGGHHVAVRLTEVEAYQGTLDAASHAYRGLTARNAVMYGPPGHLYVYFSYGMHWCANLVCGPDGRAAAVLLRAGDVVDGLDAAWSRRPAARFARELARGPARLASCLGISGALNGVDVCAADSALQLTSLPAGRVASIRSGPRVGISAAAEQPWRFWIDGDPTVSAFRPGGRPCAKGARQTDPS